MGFIWIDYYDLHALLCVTGKEYVCVVRLHDAIASETKLAQVWKSCSAPSIRDLNEV